MLRLGLLDRLSGRVDQGGRLERAKKHLGIHVRLRIVLREKKAGDEAEICVRAALVLKWKKCARVHVRMYI